MINIFEWSSRLTGNKMVREKPNRDGSPFHRGRPDSTNKAWDHNGAPTEGIPVARDSRSSFHNSSRGILMKMLIDREMSEERGTWHKPHNVIAKLMGLDATTNHLLNTNHAIPQRTVARGMLQRTCISCEAIRDTRKKEKIYQSKMPARDVQTLSYYINESRKGKDGFEMPRSLSKTGRVKNEPLLRGRFDENSCEMRMALLRQKFAEAKFHTANQKQLQSKEFQDMLEIFSSNRDLFLAYLEEPDALFPGYLQEVRRSSIPTRTKRITVLKPSRKTEESMNGFLPIVDACSWGKKQASSVSNSIYGKPECPRRPTRIVVLKPSTGNLSETKVIVTPPRSVGAKESRGSNHISKEKASQMRGGMGQRNDRGFPSPTLSNGYSADGSTIYITGDECTDDECANSSESGFLTPKSQPSQNSSDRFDSPRSLPKASHLTESPTIREAKKRLSERLVKVTSLEIDQDGERARRSTSTLGEVLALTDKKKETERHVASSILMRNSFGGESDLNTFSFSSSNEDHGNIHNENGIRDLQRSKSVPCSSTMYENVGLGSEVYNSVASKSTSTKGKPKNGRSSFKGKVSNFFTRGKKYGNDKSSSSSPSVISNVQIPMVRNKSSGGSKSDRRSEYVVHDQISSHYPEDEDERKFRDLPVKSSLILDKPMISDDASESLPQPSPISTLERPFQDDVSHWQPHGTECHRGISPSPPMVTVTRTLPSEKTPSPRVRSNPPKHLRDLLKAEIEEHERITFIRMLLSSFAINNEVPHSFFHKWYSSGSPLNPLLLEKYYECNEDVAKCREKRSDKRLIFDCVNDVLLETASVPTANSVTEEVLFRAREWFSKEAKSSCVENSRQVVDSIVRKDMRGTGWSELDRAETAELGREIEMEVFEQLLGEELDGFFDASSR